MNVYAELHQELRGLISSLLQRLSEETSRSGAEEAARMCTELKGLLECYARAFERAADARSFAVTPSAAASAQGQGIEAAAVRPQPAAQIRKYRNNNSVFIDGVYLVRGFAAVVLWKLLSDYLKQGKTQFSNRELRLGLRGQLPQRDNLEARVMLLQRRLQLHSAKLEIQKTGRGHFRLDVRGPIALKDD